MPRRLSDDLNTLDIIDNLSGCTLRLSYRMPTTSERVAYQNKAIRRRGNKIEVRSAEARLEAGLGILAGIREGDFERKDATGQYVSLSCDPNSPHYDANWKKIVGKYAPDVVEALAGRVFDGGVSIEDAEGDEADVSGPDKD